ncbi:hypothetical protein [Pseudoxanthomonas wuyuanensis]
MAALALAGCASSPVALPSRWDAARLELPPDWRIVAGARGNLNRDGRADIALLMQPSAPSNGEDGRGALLVFLSQADGSYRLAERNDSLFTAQRMDCAPPRCRIALSIKRGELRLDDSYRLHVGPYRRSQHSRFRASTDGRQLLLSQASYRMASTLTDHVLEVEWDIRRGSRQMRRSAGGRLECELRDREVPHDTTLSAFDPDRVAATACGSPLGRKPMLNFSS